MFVLFRSSSSFLWRFVVFGNELVLKLLGQIVESYLSEVAWDRFLGIIFVNQQHELRMEVLDAFDNKFSIDNGGLLAALKTGVSVMHNCVANIVTKEDDF